jgi:hypothetical protein
MSSAIHPALQKQYDRINSLRQSMEVMKENQSLRGPENYQKRMAQRAATHKTWRQMKGMQLFMHEINHPGNKPFVIGFG